MATRANQTPDQNHSLDKAGAICSAPSGPAPADQSPPAIDKTDGIFRESADRGPADQAVLIAPEVPAAQEVPAAWDEEPADWLAALAALQAQAQDLDMGY